MTTEDLIASLWQATLETFYMVGVSTLVAVLLGLPLGVLLVMTSTGNIYCFLARLGLQSKAEWFSIIRANRCDKSWGSAI